MMDKFVFIRSLVDCDGGHDAYQCMTGRKQTPQTASFWPTMGSWVSQLPGAASTRRSRRTSSLMYADRRTRWGDPVRGGFLGMAHNPFSSSAAAATWPPTT